MTSIGPGTSGDLFPSQVLGHVLGLIMAQVLGHVLKKCFLFFFLFFELNVGPSTQAGSWPNLCHVT